MLKNRRPAEARPDEVRAAIARAAEKSALDSLFPDAPREPTFEEKLQKYSTGRPPAPRPKAGELDAEVVIETHGLRFVISPLPARCLRWADLGIAMLAPAEIEKLTTGRKGKSLLAEELHALHATKLTAPEARVVAARQL